MKLVGLGALLSASAVLQAVSPLHSRESWLPFQPGKATVLKGKAESSLENRSLIATLSADGKLRIKNLYTGRTLRATIATDGQWSEPSQQAQGPSVPFEATSVPGSGVATLLRHVRFAGMDVTVNVELPPDSNAVFIRETIVPSAEINLQKITLLRGDDSNAKVVGTVPGSPIVAGDFFLGFEHPMADNSVSGSQFSCSIERKTALEPGVPVTYSAEIGVAPTGQVRRAFERMIEATRAHRFRPFLHYNSWYDLGYFTPYTAEQCVGRINAFGQALFVQRGVKLDSFLFDDGWDDHNSIWGFNKGFPDGFLPLKVAAAAYGAGPGVWLSPWGGYADPRDERLKFGKTQGMEEDSEGYALSGPKYYEKFRDVTLDFVQRQGINQFKFDGTGSPDKHYPGSKFDSDFAAAIALIQDLRHARPDLFVNLTTGTWPSPYWTRFADSIWRGGEDHSFAGVGTKRQQWITYQDGDTYHGIVEKGPLYPLNSLMLHGIIYAKYAHDLKDDPGDDFKSEVHAYFGTGTGLQELYVTPTLLTQQNWDDLAETAKWARANADVLVDTRWVGGDPMKLEVYGHASWTGGKAILQLRNPSDRPQAFSIDIKEIFELPESYSRARFTAMGAFKGDAERVDLRSGVSKVVVLKPFQVLTLEGELRK